MRRQSGRALVLGAGPIGLLATLPATQRGYDVHVVDQVSAFDADTDLAGNGKVLIR